MNRNLRPRPAHPWGARLAMCAEVLEHRLLLAAPFPAAQAAAPPPDAPGVYVRYFNNTTRIGEPVATAFAADIDFDYGPNAPQPGVNADGFSARFTGTLRAPVTGYYTLLTRSDDGAFLWMGNSELIDDPGPHPAAYRQASLGFEWTAGSELPFTLDTYDLSGDALARLMWVRPGGPGEPANVFETIPPSAFVSASRRPRDFAPYGLSVKGAGSDQVLLEFFGATLVDRYEIEVLAPGGSTARALTAGLADVPVLVDGLTPGVQYTARVRGVSVETGPTQWASVQFVFSGSSPAPIYEPSSFRTVGSAPSGDTTFRFRDNAFNETGFVILRGGPNVPPAEIARLPAAPGVGSFVSYRDTGTLPNVQYFYEIYATGDDGRRSTSAYGSVKPYVGGTGLDATVFETPNFADDPAVDGDPYALGGSGLVEDWGQGGPAPLKSSDDFSVVLRGSILPPDDTMTFYTASAGGIELKITDYDTGRTVLDFNRLDVERDMPLFGFQDVAGTVPLRRGVLYGMEVRYVERGGTAGYRVGWKHFDDGGQQVIETIPTSALFPPPPAQVPAVTGVSAKAVCDDYVTVSVNDTFATETGYDLLASYSPDGPFERAGYSLRDSSTLTDGHILIGGNHYYYKVRVLQPEPAVPFADSAAVDVFVPVVAYEMRRARFDSADNFTLSGAAAVADGRLRLTDAGAPGVGRAVTNELFNVDYDLGFDAAFDFQTSDNGSGTGLAFELHRQYPPSDAAPAAAFEFLAERGGNVNAVRFFRDGMLQSAVPVPTADPDLDFDREGNEGTLPPKVFHAHLEYSTRLHQLTLTVSNAANAAEQFQTTFAVDFEQVLGCDCGYLAFGAGAFAQGARQEVLNFEYHVLIHGDPPPGPQALYVRGSTWLGEDNNPSTTHFKEYLHDKGLGDATYGYRVYDAFGSNPAAKDIIPWTNVDEIVVQYVTAPPVSLIPAPGMMLTGIRGTYTVQTVQQPDPATFVLHLDRPLGGRPDLSATPATNGDSVRIALSGAGSDGADLSLVINVVQGDVNKSKSVLANDYSAVKARFFKNTKSAVTGTNDYDAFHDVDGSGSILANDYSAVKARFFQSLPTATPASANGAAPPAARRPRLPPRSRLADAVL